MEKVFLKITFLPRLEIIILGVEKMSFWSLNEQDFTF